MKNCIVAFCRHRGSIPGIKYYRITRPRKQMWLKALGRNPDENISIDSFVCSIHFVEEHIRADGSLTKDAIPSIYLKASEIRQREMEFASKKMEVSHKTCVFQHAMSSSSQQEFATPQEVVSDTQKIDAEVQKVIAASEKTAEIEESLTLEETSQAIGALEPPSIPPIGALREELLPVCKMITCLIFAMLRTFSPSVSIPLKSSTMEVSQNQFHPSGDNVIKNPNEIYQSLGLPTRSADVTTEKRTSKRKLENMFTSSSSADSVGLTGVLKKRRRTMRQDHAYSMSPRKIKRNLLASSEKNKILKKKLYSTQQKMNRLQSKVLFLKDIIQDLKSNDILSKNAASVLDKTYSGIPLALMKRLMTNLQSGKVTRQPFPEELKCFALTLQFYSSKAYNYVRDVFKLALPSPSVLRNWVNNVECKPGFCTSAFEVLQEITSRIISEGKKTLLCSLVLDEMAIKKQMDIVGQSTWGYIDMGTGLTDDSLELATEALVLMVTAVNDNWKIPIAYFFINKLTSVEKASIVKEALIRLHQIGIKIVSVTFDGPSAHFKMATELGAEIVDLINIRPYFEHPEDNSKIYIIFDACHMLKLLRNNWATCGAFVDMWGNFVDFKCITKLYNLQEREMLHLANKLKKAHIEWQRQKMKVNIAAQTISKSVADALQFLVELKHPDFIGAEGTIKFLRLMDSTFDLLNSRNIFGKGCKTPLKKSNENYWLPMLTESIQYLLNMKNLNGAYLIYTTNKTPFRGFIITIQSLLGLYKEYVKSEKYSLQYLLTYKFSQDHLELFFCQIRSRNGWNNNPTAFQFYYTFKRLLLKNEIKNLKGNCLIQDNTKLLEFRSTRNISRQNITIDDISIIKKYNININENITEHDYCVPQLNTISENIVGYVSGFVIKIVKKHIKCDRCILSLEDYQGSVDDSLIFYEIKNRGGLIRPSFDVMSILTKVEIQIRNILDVTEKKPPKENHFINQLSIILSNQFLLTGHIFSSLRDHADETAFDEENHVTRLIRKIIFVYLKIRFYAIAKNTTEHVRGELIRKKLNKIILFSHQ